MDSFAERYLSLVVEAGETSELMPGGVAEFVFEQKTYHHISFDDDTNNVEWLPSFLVRALEVSHLLVWWVSEIDHARERGFRSQGMVEIVSHRELSMPFAI